MIFLLYYAYEHMPCRVAKDTFALEHRYFRFYFHFQTFSDLSYVFAWLGYETTRLMSTLNFIIYDARAHERW